MMMPDFASLRRNMVDCQLRTYDVTDQAVLGAMLAVPRELFAPDRWKAFAYVDQAIALDDFGAPGRALLPPMTCGRMLQTLALKPGERFLEYSGGTGYGAALAHALGANSSLGEDSQPLRDEAVKALSQADAVGVVVTPAPESGHYDAILVAGACETKPDALFPLLSDGGRLVVIEGVGRAGRVMLYQRSRDVVSGRAVFDAAGPVLGAFRKVPAFAF
jgi:protein-L-isoaspartate(D-aspartate) O-methyltransferase